MLVDFSKLPDHARIWIYQANRKLSDDEVASIKDQVAAF